MKKVFVLIFVLLILGTVCGPVSADPPPEPGNWSQVCLMFDDMGFATHGECVTMLNEAFGPLGQRPVNFCTWYYEALGYKNLGQCVQDYEEPGPDGFSYPAQHAAARAALI